MNAQLSTRLRHLRLSGMVEALPARVAQAEAAPLAHLEFLELLVDDELSRRADRLFARRLKQAGIVTLKTLADFDWTFNAKLPKAKLVELATARFVQTLWVPEILATYFRKFWPPRSPDLNRLSAPRQASGAASGSRARRVV